MDTIINLSIKTGADIEELHLDNTQSLVKQLLNERAFKYIMAYHPFEHHRKIELNEIVKQKSSLYLIRGIMRNLQNPIEAIPVMVKISFDKRVEYETRICRKLRNLKCPLLWFSSSFYFWDTPIIVYEVLSPLSHDDDPCQVGQAILEQLRYLHRFGVHNNIKSENIGVRITKETAKDQTSFGAPVGTCDDVLVPTQKREYFLFDYEGTATEKLKWGYRRYTWQGNYSSQTPKEFNQITTPKNDLLELGYCIDKIATPQQHLYIDRYIRIVRHIDPRHIPSNIYDQLNEILEEKSNMLQSPGDTSTDEETSSSRSDHDVPPKKTCSYVSSSESEHHEEASDVKLHSCFLS